MKKFWNDIFYTNGLKQGEVSLIGTLNPIRWDSNGDAKQFSIYTDNEEDIIIQGFKNRKKLLRLLNKRVLAIGRVRLGHYGEKYIVLKQIKELAGPATPSSNQLRSRYGSIWDEDYSINIPKEYGVFQSDQLSNPFWEAS